MYVSTNTGEGYPYLYLNGSRADGSTSFPAILVNTSSTSTDTPSDELTFVYTVVYGDHTGTVLTVANRSAIRDGAALLDLQDREVNATLPVVGGVSSLSGNASLSLNTDAPVITAVQSSLPGGEYGVGQVRICAWQEGRGEVYS